MPSHFSKADGPVDLCVYVTLIVARDKSQKQEGLVLEDHPFLEEPEVGADVAQEENATPRPPRWSR